MLVRREDLKVKPDLAIWCDEVFGRVLSRQRREGGDKFEHLSEQQIEIINAMYESDCRNLIKGFRRGGLTTMMLLVVAYKLIFDRERDILYVSSSLQACKGASDLFLQILQASDQYIILLSSKNLKFSFDVLGEQKWISFVSCHQYDDIVGEVYTDGFFDNFAFYNDAKWMFELPSALAGASINVGSTPNGKDKCFWPLYERAMEGKNNFNILSMQWFLEDRFNTGLRFVNKEGEVIKNIKPTKGNICEFLSRGYGITSDYREQMSQYLTFKDVGRELDDKFFDLG